MGVITAGNLKWFKCTTYTEGDEHGGDIDLSAPITSGTKNNIFDDVTDEERISGAVEYRKIFFRNGNTAIYTDAKIWIRENTPATNDTIALLLTGGASKVGVSVQLPQTSMAFTSGSKAVTGVGTSFLSSLQPGDRIYNGTSDPVAKAVLIASIQSDTSLTLSSNYAGTTGGACQGYVAPLSGGAYISAPLKTTGLSPGDIPGEGYVGVCIRRSVTANGTDGYDGNSFILKVENS